MNRSLLDRLALCVIFTIYTKSKINLNMKYFALLVLVLFINEINGQETHLNPDVPLMDSWDMIDFVHVNIKLPKEAESIQVGEKIGEITPYPSILSTRFDNEIQQSFEYYRKGDNSNARQILEKPIVSEPNNTFILNAYARACYNIDKSTSIIVYSKLINYLDSIYKKPDSKIVVDMWFREAYWKLGTLYMDNKNWEKAKFEISRFLLSIQEMKSEYIYIQALEYLTECAFNQYDDKLALYLANRTLSYDPENNYAKEIIKEIKK